MPSHPLESPPADPPRPNGSSPVTTGAVLAVALVAILTVGAAYVRSNAGTTPTGSTAASPTSLDADCTAALSDPAPLKDCLARAVAAAGASSSASSTPISTDPPSTGTPRTVGATVADPRLDDPAARAALGLDELASWADDRAHEQWRFGDVIIANVRANHERGVVEVSISPKYEGQIDDVRAGFGSDPRVAVRLVRTPMG